MNGFLKFCLWFAGICIVGTALLGAVAFGGMAWIITLLDK